MSQLTPKKLILFGLAAILLIAIPITVYLVGKQQELKSRAAPSTTISFQPSSATAAVGQDVTFDIMINPNSNFVSFIHLVISYDPTKLEKSGAGLSINTNVFPGFDPSKPPAPTFDPTGKITVDLTVGGNPSTFIQHNNTKVGTLTLKAIATTEGTTTPITFGSETQVLTGQGDQFNTNVLSSTTPASVTITGAVTISPSPTPTQSPSRGTPTPIPPTTPTPTLPSGITATPTPTLPPGIPTPTPTTAPPGPGGPVNQSPSCTALSLDRAASGTAPYSLTFTASGNDSDGTINKATFSFGDGAVQDVTAGGGIGTKSVNAQISHTYNNAGTFQATATLTDNSGGVSSGATCTQTIIVSAALSGGGGGSGGGGAVPPPVVITPRPTMAPTGPGDIIIGIGAFGIILSIIGGFLLFIL